VTIRCRDTGGICNWQERAESEEELVEKAIQHAKEAHYMRRTLELEKTIRDQIRLD
jgi:predicted small metal-binding protein